MSGLAQINASVDLELVCTKAAVQSSQSFVQVDAVGEEGELKHFKRIPWVLSAPGNVYCSFGKLVNILRRRCKSDLALHPKHHLIAAIFFDHLSPRSNSELEMGCPLSEMRRRTFFHVKSFSKVF